MNDVDQNVSQKPKLSLSRFFVIVGILIVAQLLGRAIGSWTSVPLLGDFVFGAVLGLVIMIFFAVDARRNAKWIVPAMICCGAVVMGVHYLFDSLMSN